MQISITIDASRFRPLLAATFAFGLVALVAAGLAIKGRGSNQNSVPIGQATSIDQEAARLEGRPRTVVLTSEKARRVRNAIKIGDFSTAAKITADVLASSQLQNWRFYPFSYFINDIADVNDPTYETRLDDWVAQNKDDAIPLLIRAKYYRDLGWFIRGGKFDRETQAAHLASFTVYLGKALDDIDAAIHLDSSNPYSFYLKLDIMHGSGKSDKMVSAFSEAIAKYPGYYGLYDVMLSTLEPKWGGSMEEMYAFVDRYAGHAEENSNLKLLYISLYRNLLAAAAVGCIPYGNDKGVTAQCVAYVMQQIVKPILLNQVVAAFQLYDQTDRYQFGVVIEGILSDVLRTSGADAYAGTFLQLAASSMHSDTQLKEDKPGGNNYVIDRAVSQSWFLKGFYDNSLKKDLEALQHVEATEFPNEEDKALAIAGIYEYIAGSYDQLHQYADMIAYEKAAIAVGDKTAYEHLVCYGYYELKDYDNAVASCTDALGHVPGSMKALYWRASAYRDSDQTDAALRDFTAVADSEDNFRMSAAIDMSMIYFNRNDNQSALDVLNKYQYLYDPNVASKQDMAVGYNNRCYAYMQLGQLKEALDDCTASLKYGSIPDAYRKEQELTRRLNVQRWGDKSPPADGQSAVGRSVPLTDIR
jgi:hypothetical protein